MSGPPGLCACASRLGSCASRLGSCASRVGPPPVTEPFDRKPLDLSLGRFLAMRRGETHRSDVNTACNHHDRHVTVALHEPNDQRLLVEGHLMRSTTKRAQVLPNKQKGRPDGDDLLGRSDRSRAQALALARAGPGTLRIVSQWRKSRPGIGRAMW